MCDKLKYCARQIDPCLINQVNLLNNSGFKTILSCCGHNKYPRTIVIRKDDNTCWEFYSGMKLKEYNPKFNKRHNRYYKKDPDGYYYLIFSV